MRRFVYLLLGLFLLAALADAIQFTRPFSKVSDALKLIREQNLSKFKARYWKELDFLKIKLVIAGDNLKNALQTYSS